MITAIIKTHDNTAVLDLPCDFLEIERDLLSIGIRQSASGIALTDNEDDAVRVKLNADNEIGAHLLPLLVDRATLADTNLAVHMVTHANEEIRQELEHRILADRFSSVPELLRDIHDMTAETGPVRQFFYFPLTLRIDDGDGEIYEADPQLMLDYQQDILCAVEFEQSRDMHNMANYFWAEDNPGVKAKLVTADWTVEELSGELFGRVDVRLREPLTEEETEALRDWICGQNSDGLGEGFEQRPIRTEYGDLYVSFWHDGEDYAVMTHEEMENYLSQGPGMGELQL